MELNATFNNISSGVPAENHRPVTVSSTPRLIGIDCAGSCNSTYHMITYTTAPPKYKETQKLNSVTLFKNNINIRYSIDSFFFKYSENA